MRVQITGYEFLEALTGGDLADEAWKARRTADGRTAVVKILPALPGDNPAAGERFLQDAHRLQSLQHPGLVAVLDAGIKGGRPFTVTEFVEGSSLRELVERRGPVSENDALLVAQGVAAALAFAWDEARLCHGHLSPGNVLVDRQDVVRLADLGLARLVRGIAASPGRAGPARHRAPHYAAPEQALPEGVVDVRTDIYALGALLHHLLTGAVPFGESSDAEALSRHLLGFLPDPRERRPRISDGCVWLLERCTAKDPAARPASWDAVRADLVAVRNGGRPAGERPAPGTATVRRDERRAGAFAQATVADIGVPPPPAAGGGSPPAVFDRSGLPSEAAPAARQRVVVSPQMHRQLEHLRRRRTRSASRLSAGLLVALAAAGAGYWYLVRPTFQLPGLRDTPDRAPEPDAEGYRRYGRRGPDGVLIPDPATAAPSPDRRPIPEPPPALETIPEPPDNGAGSAPDLVGPRHPDFVAGARAFNEALALFKQFEQNRNGSILPRVERLSRAAAERFEAYARAFPNDATGRRYVDQCYGMIRYARQAMLMAGIRDDGDPEPRRRPGLSRPTPGTAVHGLRLAPGWNAAPQSGSPALRDLWLLLGSRGAPAMNLAPDPTLQIFENVPYLVPAPELVRRWNLALPEGRPVRNPAFPERSLRAHPIARQIQAPYPGAVLLTDVDGSVVGLQLVDEQPAARPVLPAALFADQWTVYDFVGLRSRAETGQRIAHRVRAGDRVVRIDTELAETDAAQPDGLGRSLFRSSLYLPQPIVDLMIFRLYTARNAPAAG